jgi:hypothetical protein
MHVEKEDLTVVRDILWPGEIVEGTAMQRRVGPGGSITVPTSVVVTNKRIIIVNRASLGIRHDYEVIPFNSITSVRLEHGLISSSVFIRVQGYDTDKGLLKNGKQEGEIDGLRNQDAEDLANLINMKLEQQPEPGQQVEKDTSVGGYIFCTKCGAKNPKDARFCERCGTPINK